MNNLFSYILGFATATCVLFIFSIAKPELMGEYLHVYKTVERTVVLNNIIYVRKDLGKIIKTPIN